MSQGVNFGGHDRDQQHDTTTTFDSDDDDRAEGSPDSTYEIQNAPPGTQTTEETDADGNTKFTVRLPQSGSPGAGPSERRQSQTGDPVPTDAQSMQEVDCDAGARPGESLYKDDAGKVFDYSDANSPVYVGTVGPDGQIQRAPMGNEAPEGYPVTGPISDDAPARKRMALPTDVPPDGPLRDVNPGEGAARPDEDLRSDRHGNVYDYSDPDNPVYAGWVEKNGALRRAA